MKIAINGFGRIGRAAFKILMDKEKSKLEIVAVNDLTDTGTLSHLLKYDSCYGRSQGRVGATKDSLIYGGRKIKVLAEKDPARLPWKELGVDIVLECTGRFLTGESAGAHIAAGAKKVLLSAPAKGEGVRTIVMGVNENDVRKTDRILSNASCTTNCLAPMTECLRKRFGIEKAMMTTIHAYTADQNLVDGPHCDLRRARAAAVNIVPTTTGAAIAAAEAIPELNGRFDGMAVRVPTPVGSLCDVVYLLKSDTDEKSINDCYRQAAKDGRLKGILIASDEELVSSDIVGNPASSIVDLSLTKVIGGNLAKVVAWYDNEWGYSNRLVDLAEMVANKKMI